MDPKLEYILNNTPSVLRNSLIVVIVRVCAGLCGTILFVFGISLIIGGFAYPEIFTYLEIKQEKDTLMGIIGIICFSLSILLFLVVWLCKKLITRNLFLMELTNWRFEREENQKKLQ